MIKICAGFCGSRDVVSPLSFKFKISWISKRLSISYGTSNLLYLRLKHSASQFSRQKNFKKAIFLEQGHRNRGTTEKGWLCRLWDIHFSLCGNLIHFSFQSMILIPSVNPLEDPETLGFCCSRIFTNILRFFSVKLMRLQRRNINVSVS